MSAPKIHILRAKPPWRDGPDLTVCGRDPATVKMVTVADLVVRFRLDRLAAEAQTCGTCRTASRHAMYKWEKSPIEIIMLDVHPMCVPARRRQLATELHALAALAAEYPERFRWLLESEAILKSLAGL